MQVKRDFLERIFLNGKVVKRSHNLRGIREYTRENVIKFVDIAETTDGSGRGSLVVEFENGAIYQTRFEDFSFLRNWVRDWRGAYGAPLYVNAIRQGIVSRTNP